MSDLTTCPKCGGSLLMDSALLGGCPRCMLELGFDTSVGKRERRKQGDVADCVKQQSNSRNVN